MVGISRKKTHTDIYRQTGAKSIAVKLTLKWLNLIFTVRFEKSTIAVLPKIEVRFQGEETQVRLFPVSGCCRYKAHTHTLTP